MNEENEALYVSEADIRPTLQHFFNGTKWAEKSRTGELPIREDEWHIIIKDFQREFPHDPVSREYIVTEGKLFNFINEQIVFLVEQTMLEMTDAGLVDMIATRDGEIKFRGKGNLL